MSKIIPNSSLKGGLVSFCFIDDKLDPEEFGKKTALGEGRTWKQKPLVQYPHSDRTIIYIEEKEDDVTSILHKEHSKMDDP